MQKLLPTQMMVTICEQVMQLMQRVLAGEMVDDALLERVLGSKESVVQQLQRVSDVLTEVQALEAQIAQPDGQSETEHSAMDAQEKAIIRYYVEQMARHYAKAEQTSAAANADDV